MEKTRVFKKVIEVEGISAEDLERRKNIFCPVCGKQDGVAVTIDGIYAYCDEHKFYWIEKSCDSSCKGWYGIIGNTDGGPKYAFIEDGDWKILSDCGIKEWKELRKAKSREQFRKVLEGEFLKTDLPEEELETVTARDSENSVIGQGDDAPNKVAYCPICGYADVSGSIARETLLGCTKHNLFWTYMYENNIGYEPEEELLATAKAFSRMSYVRDYKDGIRLLYPPRHPAVIENLFRYLNNPPPANE